MNKVGILLNNLGRNQLAHSAIGSLNQYLDGRIDTDIIAFVENMVQPCKLTQFSVMNLNEAWEYNALLIATNLSTAEKALLFPGAKRRVLYVWDLEWLRGDEDFEYYHGIYGNPRLDLIARSEEHAKIIERCWNRPTKAVVEDCQIEALIKHGNTKN